MIIRIFFLQINREWNVVVEPATGMVGTGSYGFSILESEIQILM